MYIIEANPRASRTVPFVAKAIGHPLAKYASLLMAGATLPELGFTEEPKVCLCSCCLLCARVCARAGASGRVGAWNVAHGRCYFHAVLLLDACSLPTHVIPCI